MFQRNKKKTIVEEDFKKRVERRKVARQLFAQIIS